MPKDLPTAPQAWEDVTFFSIDTNLIQAAGYNFKQGALHQLPNQLPESIGLQLPEIVVTEIVAHQMSPVSKAQENLERASRELKRQVGLDVSELQTSIEKLNTIEAATIEFTKRAYDYAIECRGAVLPTAGAEAVTDLFADYFARKPPFGPGEKKKAEFPDAMCLWQLEQYAKDNGTMGIIASDDIGWKQYAAVSETLYCVGSLEDLARLFAATNEYAQSVKSKIAVALMDAKSPLGEALARAIDQHITDARWDSSDVYTSSSLQIEPGYGHAKVADYTIEGDAKVWSQKGEPTTWIVELSVSIEADVTVPVEFSIWDSIDKDEVPLGTHEFDVKEVVVVEVFLTCSDVRLDTEPTDWEITIEIAKGQYSVEEFDAELDLSSDDER